MKMESYKFEKAQFHIDYNKAKRMKERNAILVLLWASFGTVLNYDKSTLARECIRETWSIVGKKH